jgi:hypothetical protein
MAKIVVDSKLMTEGATQRSKVHQTNFKDALTSCSVLDIVEGFTVTFEMKK